VMYVLIYVVMSVFFSFEDLTTVMPLS
jgi:hypothetical protein